MLSLTWIKSTKNTWLKLNDFNIEDVTAKGVYIIWHAGNPGRVVYVGQGDVKARLTSHRSNRDIQAYKDKGLFVTWASVAANQRDGVERYLADKWSPLVGDAHPNVSQVAVNSPW
jgi:hypothetical protein